MGVSQSTISVVAPLLYVICQSLAVPSVPFLLYFLSQPPVPVPSGFPQRWEPTGSVLIWPRKGPGDNMPAVDIRCCALPLLGSGAVGVSRCSR